MSVSSIPGVTIVQNNTTPKRESAVLEDVMEFLRGIYLSLDHYTFTSLTFLNYRKRI